MANIENSQDILSIFGQWPSFHDAEVSSIVLDRQGQGDYDGPTVDMIVRVFEITHQTNGGGQYALRHPTLVSFRFFQVDGLKLASFNQQNALCGLEITDVSGRQMELIRLRVTFRSTFGVDGEFVCRAAAVLAADPLTPDK